MSQAGLHGRRVVVTQAEHQAPELAALLARRGATALLYPCIAIVPPAEVAPLDRALAEAASGGFDWLVLTSANAVRVVADRLAAVGLAPDALQTVAIATVGAATAEAVQKILNLPVALVPDEHVAEELAAALAGAMQPGARILLPQAELARPVLAEQLAAAGARVTQVVAYRTVRGSGGVALPRLLAAGEVDAITLTSSSTFQFLRERLADEGGDAALLHGVCLACIGPVTAEAVQKAGFTPGVVAGEQSLEGLVDALAHQFAGAQSGAHRSDRIEESL